MSGDIGLVENLIESRRVADVHHEIERLAELLGDPRLIDDAWVPFRPQVLDIVAEVDARGQRGTDRDSDQPDDHRRSRAGERHIDQMTGAERMEIQLRCAPALLPLGENDQRRQ